MEPENSFPGFLTRFMSRHPEWFSDIRGREWGSGERESFEMALDKVPATEPLAGDSLEAAVAKQEAQREGENGSEGAGNSGCADGDIWAEEVRDEEAEAEEAAALLSDPGEEAGEVVGS